MIFVGGLALPMRHNVLLTGFGYCLRPVTLDDAPEIVAMRVDPRNARYINQTSPQVADQETWLQLYFERTGDWYFVLESRITGATEGLIGIYDYNSAANTAEWGRWIVRAGSMAAVELALLIYRAAFEVLKLDAIYCRTVAENSRVVSFHDNSGAPRTRLFRGTAVIRGLIYDQIEHRVDSTRWAEMEPKLTHLAQLAAARHARGFN